MSTEGISVDEVLNQFETSSAPYHEYDVSRALQGLRPADVQWDLLPTSLRAELMAFAFHPVPREEESAWGTYFGPMFAATTNDGQIVEWPSLTQVTREILSYWAQRARSSSHPVLRLRYADLAWDLCRPVLGKSGDHANARIVVNAALDIIARRLYVHEVDGIDYLRRALSLALSLNDPDLVARVRDAILDFEEATAQDDQLGTWGFAFDLLVDNKDIPLSQSQEELIIGRLEDRLTRYAASPPGTIPNHHVAHAAASRLAQYYRKRSRREDVHRVLKMWGEACLRATDSQRPFQAAIFLEEVYRVYIAEGMQEEATKLQPMLRCLWQKARSDMKKIEVKVSIPNDRLNEYVSSMTEGRLDEVLSRVAFRFVPNQQETAVRISQLADEAVLTSLTTKIIVDDAGLPVARVGSLESDLEGRLVDQIREELYLSSVFLRRVLDRMLQRFRPTPDSFTDYLMASPAFDLTKRPIIREGIAAYLRGDWLVALHLLIPVVEDAIRSVVLKTTGNVYAPNRLGGIDYRPMDALLRDPGAIGSLGEDAVSYLRVLFVDRRGWNLRNRLCHGLMTPEEFNDVAADRVLHALLVLGQLRSEPDVIGEDGEAAGERDLDQSR